ncbi:MAG: hypothetical protein AAF288_00665 [Planctomycetota bacterium]
MTTSPTDTAQTEALLADESISPEVLAYARALLDAQRAAQPAGPQSPDAPPSFAEPGEPSAVSSAQAPDTPSAESVRVIEPVAASTPSTPPTRQASSTAAPTSEPEPEPNRTAPEPQEVRIVVDRGDDARPETPAPRDPVALVADALAQLTREAMDPETDFERRRELAAQAALLAVAAGDGAPPMALLDSLGRDDARRAESLARVAGLARHAAVEPAGDLTDLRREIDALAPLLGVRATTLELCSRVAGYGVYDPIRQRTFALGQPHQLIVYVELEGFASKPMPGSDEYEVRLQQELTLFETTRGLAVWRQKPAEIVDRSRNRRRDFFVVQMATLPDDLPSGEYVLKVTGTDKHAGMVYARGVEIEIGASELVAQPGER